VEIRLAQPGPDDTLVAVGEWHHPPRNPNLFRLTAQGKVDPTFHDFSMPGRYPQGRFLHAGAFAPDGEGGWYLSFSRLPGPVPPNAGPGLVHLGADGAVDTAFVQALGLGVRDSRSVEKPEGGGSLPLVVPFSGHRVMLAGVFDQVGATKVTSPCILQPDGKPDLHFQPHFSTELPPPPPVESAQTSAFVPADGKPHYLRCEVSGKRATTFLYVLEGDPWGHRPCCMIHMGGDMAAPGGGWQDCDLRAAALQRAGATCKETPDDPMHFGTGHK
jgi:hypothetical protein